MYTVGIIVQSYGVRLGADNADFGHLRLPGQVKDIFDPDVASCSVDGTDCKDFVTGEQITFCDVLSGRV